MNRFFGGQFTTASDGRSPLNYLASLDGQNFFQIGNLDNNVHSLVMNGTSTLYVGGQFISSGSTQLNKIGNWISFLEFQFFFLVLNLLKQIETKAGWDGKQMFPLGNGFSGPVNAMAMNGTNQL